MDRYSMRFLIILAITALGKCELIVGDAVNTLVNETQVHNHQPSSLNKHLPKIKSPELPTSFTSDMQELKNVMFEYVGDVLNREKINLMPGVFIEKTQTKRAEEKIEKKSLDKNLISTIKEFADTHALRIDLARATSETGRLFFFKGKSRL